MRIVAWLRRLIAEHKSPSLRCTRVGHRLREDWREGYRTPDDWDFMSVAYSIREQRFRCLRCGYKEPWNQLHSEPLQGLEMSKERWRKLEDQGVLWIRQGTRRTP